MKIPLVRQTIRAQFGKSHLFFRQVGRRHFSIARTFFILVILFFVNACDRCGNPEPPFPAFKFVLVDDSTGLSLIGTDRLYHPDTINNLNKNGVRVSSTRDTLLFFNFGNASTGANYILALDSVTSDTVQVRFTVNQGRCYTFKDLKEFRYNGELILPENQLYRVVLDR